MTVEKTILAKISRPFLTGAVIRERLFTLLDGGSTKPVTWLSASGGSGKSTLVASYLDSRKLPCIWYHCDEGDADLASFFYYMGLAAKQAAPRFRKPLPLLTPEYLAGIPTFTRRYFETLYSRCKTIVFDNYQDVPAASSFHNMIATALDALPDGVHIVVISRSAPPPALARLQTNGKIGLLPYSDIRFTCDESRELVQRRIPHLDDEFMRALHEKTAGWAAGIILMAERGTCEGTVAESNYDRVFNYFAGEIFNRAEQEVQDFLLKTSFLPALSASLAGELVGTDFAGQILSTLNSHHFFTERLSGGGDGYLYHPLFREFLQNRAKSLLAPAALADIQQEAARLLEQAGQIEDAARLYGDAGDSAGLARIVTGHARELLTQGRSTTVKEWLSSLPVKTVNGDPWLLYWSGICLFPMDLPGTRQYLEQALALFRIKADLSGIYLSWAGIVDSHAFGDEWKNLDSCITLFDDLRRSHPSFPSQEIELVASSRMLLSLTLRKTNQPELVEYWLARVCALLLENPSFDIQMDTCFCMSVYYLWKGEYDKNALLLERAVAEVSHRKASPFAVIRIKLMKGIHYWITAEYQAALQTLSEGLDVSAKSGVHLYDSLLWSFKAAAEMATGDMENAGNSVKHQLKSLFGMENALNSFFHHINSAWHALLTGSPSRAAEHMEPAFARAESMGTPYYQALWQVAMAQVTFSQGHAQESRKLVLTAHRISLSMKSQVLEWYSLLIDAWILLLEGEETEGLLSLHRGLSLGRRHGYVHLEFYQPDVMRFLFAKALEERIEQEYVTALIGKLNLTPPQSINSVTSALYLEEWPYPIKIHALGRFEIIRDGEPLYFSGKEQKKPLEMLKALISFGGRDVPRERLTDALWPDADGDQAQKSFETTLSRLRRLLGRDDYVICRSRLVTINSLYCRVDYLALECLLNKIQAGRNDLVVAYCEKAIAQYKGDFLPSDMSQHWTVTARETLKNRLLRAIGTVGRHYEQAGEWQVAVAHYSQGIEIDGLAEEFHRRLMLCHRNLGNYSEVAKTYNRCRTQLQTILDIAPSPETTSVYTSIVQKQ